MSNFGLYKAFDELGIDYAKTAVGDKWYIGGMTNNKEQQRVFDLALDFLPEGQTWKMISYEDGVNANKQAMHYMKREKQVKKGDKIQVKMARNGGFAAVLTAE